jgi:glycerol-3-phosphate acyltransferase PlsX
MSIVLDAMGTDRHPEPELHAAVQAATIFNEEIILVGDEQLLGHKLAELNKENARVRIVHARDTLLMTDHPVEGTRQKPDNSIAKGIELVKDGTASAFVTAGNTGAVSFNAIRILTRLKGITRPALCTTLPTQKGKCVFIDMGANVDCRPEFLVEFAVMGKTYSEKVLGVNNPRIALLSNGEEEIKGNQLIKDTQPKLKAIGMNFIGNVEPKELLAGEADVVVVDGFIGNIFIKTGEALAKFIKDTLTAEIKSSKIMMVGGALVKPAFKRLFKLIDPAEVGAGMLLGVEGNVFIGHGRSDSRALVSAINLARLAVQTNLLEGLREEIHTYVPQLEARSLKAG